VRVGATRRIITRRVARQALYVAMMSVVIAAAPVPRVTTLFLIGDSTMAERPDTTITAERGWGQMLQPFFDKGVVVRDLAVNGRSSKSFIDEGKWTAALSQMRRGDYVVIEFGHNDEKIDDPTRYTNPYTGYRRNLQRYIDDSRARGATPIVFSPIVRRKFNSHGVLEDTHGAYAIVAREVARDAKAPFVDLQLMTEDLVASKGAEESKELYVWFKPGESALYPQGHQDDTHLRAAGARAVAELAAKGIMQTGLPLARHIKLPN
jgi:lysophospholipase L1-like esterase